MLDNFDDSLSGLLGLQVNVSPDLSEPGNGAISLSFSNGAVLTAAYWRVVENSRAGISSFDHEQQYGLPAPLDAIKMLHDALAERQVYSASLDHSTGDLLFGFAGGLSLQIFNFTGYEIWHIAFPDGTGEYSNYCK